MNSIYISNKYLKIEYSICILIRSAFRISHREVLTRFTDQIFDLETPIRSADIEYRI